jgi:hypothetical protein
VETPGAPWPEPTGVPPGSGVNWRKVGVSITRAARPSSSPASIRAWRSSKGSQSPADRDGWASLVCCRDRRVTGGWRLDA